MVENIRQKLGELGKKAAFEVFRAAKSAAKGKWDDRVEKRTQIELAEKGFALRYKYAIDKEHKYVLIYDQKNSLRYVGIEREGVLISLFNDKDEFCGEVHESRRVFPKFGFHHPRNYSIVLPDGQYDTLTYVPIRQTQHVLQAKGGPDKTKSAERYARYKGLYRCFKLEQTGWEAVCDLSRIALPFTIYDSAGRVVAESGRRSMHRDNIDIAKPEDDILGLLVFFALSHECVIEYPQYSQASNYSSGGEE